MSTKKNQESKQYPQQAKQDRIVSLQAAKETDLPIIHQLSQLQSQKKLDSALQEDKKLEFFQRSLQKQLSKDQACSNRDNNHCIYYRLGLALKNMNLQDEAIQCFMKQIEINPNFQDSYVRLREFFNEANNIHEAISYFKRTLQLNSLNYQAYIDLGDTLVKGTRIDLAIACYQKALNLNKQSFIACNNLGNAFNKLNDKQKALEHYTKAVAINPDAYETFSNMGHIFLNQNKFDQAIQYYIKAFELNSLAYPKFQNLAIALSRINKTDQAMQVLGKLIKKQQENKKYHFLLENRLNKLKNIQLILKSFFKHQFYELNKH